MNYISFEFLVFLLAVLAFLILARGRTRKWIILAASCIFYAWWDWRFLCLFIGVSVLNYFLAGWSIRADARLKGVVFWSAIAINLGLLGYFKYVNFFIDSLNVLVGSLGLKLGALNIIAPLGISFFTFESISYLTDRYIGLIESTDTLLDYLCFSLFFPRVVSGPIIRAGDFFQQLGNTKTLRFDDFYEGLQLFLRGMLLKLVVADNLSIMTDAVFSSPSMFSPFTTWIAILGYSIQIFCDFSGYTDMARGVGKMLGFDLPINFNLPYIAQSITDFWRRWHITLSTWFRDYVLYPLQMKRRSMDRLSQSLNIMVVYLLTGLWHGANWNFILWGVLHGIYMNVELFFFRKRSAPASWHSPRAWLRALFIFVLVSVTWIPFRSPDWATTGILFGKLLFLDWKFHFDWIYPCVPLFILVIFLGGLIASRFGWKWPILKIQNHLSLVVIILEILVIFYFFSTRTSPFIYFQF